MSPAFLNFLHPALLWGAALVAVPFLIHLFNKRRFRVVDWAAMDLLRRVDRRNRRRLQLEDWLLLLLRGLVVLLLVLLVARTILTGAAGLAPVAGARTERIFILDDSPSMAVRQGNRTLFSQATAALGEYARQLARSRPGDTLTVMLTSAPEQPFLNGQVLSGARAPHAASALAALPISAMPARFEQTFLTLRRTLAREPAAPRAIYIISDFRRHDWLDPQGRVRQQLAALAATVPELPLINVGQPVANDLAIADLRPAERLLTLGVPAEFRVTVANRGRRDQAGAAVTVTADGAPAGRVNLPALAPGAAQTVAVPVTFAHAGPVAVAAELTAADAFALDDRRDYADSVAAAVRVLVVDGEPDADAARRASFYLRRALAPPGPRVSGLGVEVVAADAFEPRHLEGRQLLFLANVSGLTADLWRAVADWVRGGGGLVVFPGDQVDGAAWNETTAAAAPGLLPARFGEPAGDPTEREWQPLRLSQPEHPVLQEFTGDRNPFLQRVKVFRYWRLEPAAPGTVLATFGNGRPALVESRLGAGRVLLFATAAAAEWSNWPGDPSYVATLQQVARYVARAAAAARVLTVGEPLRHEVSPALYRSEARLLPPGAPEAELLRATAGANPAALVFAYGALRQPGIWTLALTTHEGEAVRVPFAVNMVAAESELDGVEPGEFLRRAGNPRLRWVSGPEIPDVAAAAGGQTDLTRLLAAALIGALMLEQCLAWWLGRRRARPPENREACGEYC